MRTRIGVAVTALAAVAGLALAAPASAGGMTPQQHAPGSGTYPSSAAVHGYQFQTEPYGMNGAWCGPAATRLAITAQGKYPSVSTLASEERAGGSRSGAGTATIGLVTTSLNKHIGRNFYQNKTSKSLTTLKRDLRYDFTHGYVIVANVKGSAKDTQGRTRRYSGGHYLDVVGYYNDASRVTIEDIAYPRTPSSGSGYHRRYNMTTANLLNWINFGYSGYSA
ncbi:C39 family peptidase [Streptomyces sp. NBC_01387]|uniref:C39 family peptidase n=1 Tax=unclassified Streptomyces TaxID=2593676 RepID=UPI0020258A11|nr:MULTISPECIES: C39 family peptidase [unclassified Streptomyces]MCX4547297.1 C39 family peptidase [Streptomyces sp. NBC_01500]WSC19024.1 C39 family peptidase [Streptomyces sp. NBC_01766]